MSVSAAPVQVTQTEYEIVVCAHAGHYAAFAAREGPRLKGAGSPDKGRAQQTALAVWKLELENVYEALDTALNRGVLDWLLPLAEHLGSLLERTSQLHAMQQRYDVLVEAAQQLASPQLGLFAHLGLSRALWQQGNLAAAETAGATAQSLGVALGDGRASAQALNIMGVVHWQRGEFDRALELFAQSQTMCQRLGDEVGAAGTLGNMGLVHYMRGDLDRALELFAQSLEVAQRLGNELGASQNLSNMGILHRQRGDLGRALELYAQSLAVEQRQGYELGAAMTQTNMGIVHWQRGDFDQALELFARSLEVKRRLGAKTGMVETLVAAAVALAGLGQLRHAALTLHGALAKADKLGYLFNDQAPIDDGLAHLDAAVAASEITASELAQWRAQGEAMSIDELADHTLKALAEAGNESNAGQA